MFTKEWQGVVDKSEWGPGPWQDEPDKAQWLDAGSRLPCLIVRGPVGALCGYVGLPPGHRARRATFESSYQIDPKRAATMSVLERMTIRRRGNNGAPGYYVLDRYVEVHGGLTFCGPCDDPGPLDWERAKATVARMRAAAEGYPLGDAARWLKTWLPVLDDYDKWRALRAARGICHLAGPGDFKHVRWVGFDCAHFRDFVPAINVLRKHTGFADVFDDDVYRDFDYVKAECASLARQLAALGPRRTWKARY